MQSTARACNGLSEKIHRAWVMTGFCLGHTTVLLPLVLTIQNSDWDLLPSGDKLYKVHTMSPVVKLPGGKKACHSTPKTGL